MSMVQGEPFLLLCTLFLKLFGICVPLTQSFQEQTLERTNKSIVTHDFNPNTREAEAVELHEF